MKLCHACTKELLLGKEIGRRDECPFCKADMHCCLNCAFYDRSAPKQCKEPLVELVREKDKANYCDYFRFSEKTGAGPAKDDAAVARKALDDLFKT